ncbi:MAG: hypothetical protein HY554_02170 [Elusimicrobia bacterium]|nr:hypothetical protein [Elusimicrobiota bacterium]
MSRLGASSWRPGRGAWLAAFVAAAAAGCSHGRLKPQPGERGEVIEAEGWAPLDPQDVLGTKQRALAEAQKKAVERVVGVFISAKTRVDQAVNVDQRILANVKGYIRKYDLVSEREDGGFLKTRIRALVLYQKIGDDLKDLGLVRPPPPPGNPKVVVRLRARGRGKEEFGEAAAQGVRRALVERGFLVVEEGHGDLVVTGETEAHPIEDARLAGFRSFRARVSLQAAKANGEVLSQKSQEASGLDPSGPVAEGKAYDAAGALAGEAVAAELLALLKGRVSVVVRVFGFSGLDTVQRFVDDLRNNPGVAAVTLGSYGEGKTELQVTTDDVAGEELAAMVLRMKKFQFTARSVTPYEVEVDGR